MDNLEKISGSNQKRFISNQIILSYPSFLKDVQTSPSKYCRNSAEYLKSVFDHYGNYPVKDVDSASISRWKIFDLFRPVWGQERAQNQIYNHVKYFAENRINKIILIHGPNGSSKTSIVACIMDAMEEYCKLDQGAIYSFNWLFSDEADKPLGIGFQDKKNFNEETLAFTPATDITFKISCDMKDNPLLLIPKKEREQFLLQLGIPKPKHLIERELCQKCQEIYNQLEIAYQGDWKRIIRHIQVERFYFSKRNRKGLVSIEPQRNTDASSRPLNVEKSYRLPNVLSLSSLFEPFGDLIDANRGIVEFSEIFKRHSETNKYLLTTAEWGTINLPSFTAQLDCIIFATDNEFNLSLFKHDLDWPSFNGRLAYVKAPYLLKWSEEKKIYAEEFKELTKGKHVAPHTEDIISLWATITRLRKSKHRLAKNLSYIQKAMLYDNGEAPDYWKDEDRKELLADLTHIVSEFEDSQDRVIANQAGDSIRDVAYEGRSGASYREVVNVIIKAINFKEYKHLSPIAIFDAIEELSKDKTLYEFLRLTENSGHIETEKNLKEIKRHYCKLIQKDLRDSAGLVSEDEYLKLFERYIQHVRAWNKKEKILNSQTQQLEDPNQSILNNVEELLDISEKEEWRQSLLKKVAAWAICHQGLPIPYTTLFSDTIEIIKNATYEKHQAQLKRIQTGVLYYQTDDWKMLSAEEQAHVTITIDNMKKRRYIEDSMKEVILFLMEQEQ